MHTLLSRFLFSKGKNFEENVTEIHTNIENKLVLSSEKHFQRFSITFPVYKEMGEMLFKKRIIFQFMNPVE